MIPQVERPPSSWQPTLQLPANRDATASWTLDGSSDGRMNANTLLTCLSNRISSLLPSLSLSNSLPLFLFFLHSRYVSAYLCPLLCPSTLYAKIRKYRYIYYVYVYVSLCVLIFVWLRLSLCLFLSISVCVNVSLNFLNFI